MVTVGQPPQLTREFKQTNLCPGTELVLNKFFPRHLVTAGKHKPNEENLTWTIEGEREVKPRSILPRDIDDKVNRMYIYMLCALSS